ncbi:6-bladed beta-propeller, partial [Candidatus Dojkabacteria bacterium]|nr:6-bladed beta-propeller [Candidatus Dojkabacteria bacterium]
NNAGNLVVLDGDNGYIQIFDTDGNFISKFGSYGSGDGQMKSASGFTMDDDGNYYVADTYNARVQKFDSDGSFLFKFGSSGTGDGEFDYPGDIEVDDEGNMYVVDSSNGNMQKFDPSGNFLFSWDLQNPCWSTSIQFDQNGNLLIVDGCSSDGMTIKSYSVDGEFLMGFGGMRYIDGGYYTAYTYQPYFFGDYLYVVNSVYGRIHVFLFDYDAPSLTISTTAGLLPASARTLSGSLSDTMTAITSVEYQAVAAGGSVDESGTWTVCSAVDGAFDELSENYTCDLTGLVDGTYTVYVRGTDSKENTNEGAEIKSVEVIIDTTIDEPILTKLGTVTFDPPYGTWYYTGRQPKLVGTAEAGSTVYVQIGTKLYSTEVDEEGNWELTPEEIETGEYEVQMWVEDEAGNISTKLEFTLVIDPTGALFPDWLKEKLGILTLDGLSSDEELVEIAVSEESQQIFLNTEENDTNGQSALIIASAVAFIGGLSLIGLLLYLLKTDNILIPGALGVILFLLLYQNKNVIYDKKTKKPIEGAELSIKQNNGVVEITKTDAKGRYNIKTNKGSYILEVRKTGYKTYSKIIGHGERMNTLIGLEPLLN